MLRGLIHKGIDHQDCEPTPLRTSQCNLTVHILTVICCSSAQLCQHSQSVASLSYYGNLVLPHMSSGVVPYYARFSQAYKHEDGNHFCGQGPLWIAS